MAFVIARCQLALDIMFAKKCATDSLNNDREDSTYPNSNQVDGVDEHGNTPLHNCSANPKAWCTNLEMFAILVDADPTATKQRNRWGKYPICPSRCTM